MTIFQPVTAESNAIVRPRCPKCGTAMYLARIEPDVPDYDLRTFECPRCLHPESVRAKKLVHLRKRTSQ
jgi:DNA-directed RNA polymerase subunit M/transcription elongation factor TFIIS